MDKEKLELQARLATLEHMLQLLFAKVYYVQNLSSDDIKRSHEAIRKARQTETWNNIQDPATIALLSGLFEDACNDFLRGLEDKLKLAGRLTG
jgi:hypothetical protein